MKEHPEWNVGNGHKQMYTSHVGNAVEILQDFIHRHPEAKVSKVGSDIPSFESVVLEAQKYMDKATGISEAQRADLDLVDNLKHAYEHTAHAAGDSMKALGGKPGSHDLRFVSSDIANRATLMFDKAKRFKSSAINKTLDNDYTQSFIKSVKDFGIWMTKIALPVLDKVAEELVQSAKKVVNLSNKFVSKDVKGIFKHD